LNIKGRAVIAYENVTDIMGIWIYVIIGVILRGSFHGYAPEGILAKHASKNKPLTIPIAIIIGVSLYSNTMAMIPVVESLIAKGFL
jgi:uncharacterized protein